VAKNKGRSYNPKLNDNPIKKNVNPDEQNDVQVDEYKSSLEDEPEIDFSKIKIITEPPQQEEQVQEEVQEDEFLIKDPVLPDEDEFMNQVIQSMPQEPVPELDLDLEPIQISPIDEERFEKSVEKPKKVVQEKPIQKLKEEKKKSKNDLPPVYKVGRNTETKEVEIIKEEVPAKIEEEVIMPETRLSILNKLLGDAQTGIIKAEIEIEIQDAIVKQTFDTKALENEQRKLAALRSNLDSIKKRKEIIDSLIAKEK
jgi:hypothetical protein